MYIANALFCTSNSHSLQSNHYVNIQWVRLLPLVSWMGRIWKRKLKYLRCGLYLQPEQSLSHQIQKIQGTNSEHSSVVVCFINIKRGSFTSHSSEKVCVQEKLSECQDLSTTEKLSLNCVYLSRKLGQS